MTNVLDHVSILVNSVDKSAQKLAVYGFIVGNKETFDDVGTEEVYIGSFEMTALLLLQGVIGDGPYKRAMEKRGCGLHHIAICTDDFEEHNELLSNLGWYIHPYSMKKYHPENPMFYVKPGVRGIIELITKKETVDGERFINEVMIRVDKGFERCINGLGVNGLKCSVDEEPSIIIAGRKIVINELV
jgi:hypothetical protein